MKVVVLTTSYPTPEHPVAGTFVASAVEGVRAAGVDVDVVSPADFPHFGIAFGGGIAQNLRAAPWKLALAPAFLATFSLAARRAASDADLVHAHWIPSAIAARATGKPYVLQVWGTDVELARRAPGLVRPLLRGARVVIGASAHLAEAALALGARDVRVVPTPVPVPEQVGEPDDPPHVLFAGRLSEEKGILEFLAATGDVRRVVVGDGPLRDRVPEAQGFVPPSEIGSYFRRAAVVAVPSRREGYGMTAREALAWGRPVVATRVGGLAELTAGVMHVDPGNASALREAIVALLSDAGRRSELGAAGRAAAVSADTTGQLLRTTYVSSLGLPRRALITGIGGQDGSFLAELLLEQGYEVFGIAPRPINEYPNLAEVVDRIHVRRVDLLDAASLERTLREAEADEVYNLASISFVPASWDEPVITAELAAVGTTVMLETVRKVDSGIRFYQASSSEIFGEPMETPQSERTPLSPLTPYGVAKAYAHWITRSYRNRYDLHASSGILYNHESSRRPATFLPRKVSRAVAQIAAGLQSELMLGELDARRDWGYARDYVRAMWLMLQQPEPSDYVVATGESHSVRELVACAFGHVGLDYEQYVRRDPSLLRGRAELHHLVGDASKARAELGLAPSLSFEELVGTLVEADVRALTPQRA